MHWDSNAPEQVEELERPFTESEIWRAMSNLHRTRQAHQGIL